MKRGMIKVTITIVAVLFFTNWGNAIPRIKSGSDATGSLSPLVPPLLLVAEIEKQQSSVMRSFCECYIAIRCHRRKRPDQPLGHCKETARVECETKYLQTGTEGLRSMLRQHIHRFEQLVHVAPVIQCATVKKTLRAPTK
jgi:hypothetical protein